MKKNVNIQLIRVLAMFSIILCHIVQIFNNEYIAMTGQFLNIGVYIFLIISGLLYSKKNINAQKFYHDRVLKILIPMYIFMIPVYILQLFNKTFSVNTFIVYTFNLQGIFKRIPGASHLWFLTAIFWCYIILPFLQKIRDNKKNINVFFGLSAIIAIITCYFNRNIGVISICTIAYLIGYFYLPKLYSKKINKILLIVIFLISIMIRLFFKVKFDSTIVYDLIVVGLTQIISSVCLILFLSQINFLWLENNKTLNFVDKYSFYIYITHYFFMNGPASIINIFSNKPVTIIILIFLSVFYAIILQKLTNFALKKLEVKKIGKI